MCLCAHCTPNKYRLANEKLQNTQIEFTVNESEYCEKWVNKHFQTILNLFYQLAKSIFRHSLCKQQVIYAMLACRNCVKTCLEWRIKKITLTYRKTEKKRTNTYHYKLKRGKKRQSKRKRAQKKYWNADIQTMASQAIVMMPQCSNRPVIHRYFSLVVIAVAVASIFFSRVFLLCLVMWGKYKSSHSGTKTKTFGWTPMLESRSTYYFNSFQGEYANALHIPYILRWMLYKSAH